jgi:hypothetical protein
MVMMTNSLVLDCVIEFLCKHDQFEEKINVEKSFLEQIAALSQSSVEHIITIFNPAKLYYLLNSRLGCPFYPLQN